MYFRHPLASGITFVLLTVAFFFLFYRSPKETDSTAFLGTWTEETGEPGNYISFGLVNVSSPNSLISLYEGRVVFHKQLDLDHTMVTWNFGDHKTLELNVIVPGKCTFASVRMLDADHMLIRFTDDLNALRRSDFFDSPEVKRMMRAEGKAGIRD
jgi:hypothetical protein